ncbi:MAG: hypothetical protein SFW66_04305 [Gammaproteobacteria bacterium]|nr:hypothetical protein [Gammaproteobacteria bacterium]
MSNEIENTAENLNDEVVAAYNEILMQLKDAKKVTTETPIEEERLAVIESFTKETPEDAMQHFDEIKRILNHSLEDVRDQYLTEQKKLLQIADAIESKSKALADLHQIEVNLDSLSALLLAHREKSAAFEKEMEERRSQFEAEMTSKQKEFQQEEQKFISQRELTRMKERNQYEIAKRTQEQELSAIRQKFEKDMSQREARINANEQALSQLEQLREKVERFPVELEEAIKNTEESVTRSLTLKFDYEMQLAQKEMRLYQQTIETLETKIALLESNISRFESLKSSFSRLLLEPAENAG